MVNISLQEMFVILTNSILNNQEPPTFYYRNEWETGHPEYVEITEVDLLQGRFKTKDDDFSEYEWELEDSNIYIEEVDIGEIYVNEYVRSTDGYIGKVLEITKEERECDIWYKTDKVMASGYYEHFKKHSFDIIDLVEVGDIVNDHRVVATYLDGTRKYIKLDNAYENDKGIRTYSEDIKTIETKEQHLKESYKI